MSVWHYYITVVLMISAAFSETVQDTRSFLKETLSGDSVKTKELFALSVEQKAKLVSVAERASDSAFTFYFGKDANGKIHVACTVVPQEGKEGPMTIGVCFEPSGIVKSVRILEYSEERGKPVKELSFLNQFVGKKTGSIFRVGKDVDAVSGATRSSEAVSEAVRKASFAFDQFVAKKKGG